MSCYFQCYFLFYSTDDMVVGTLGRSDRLKEEPVHTDERKPVQLQPPLVAANETEVNNTESVTLLVDNSHMLADENAPGETMINHSPVMPSDDNNPMSPLSNKSHMQFYSTRSRLSSSSVPTGKHVMFVKWTCLSHLISGNVWHDFYSLFLTYNMISLLLCDHYNIHNIISYIRR